MCLKWNKNTNEWIFQRIRISSIDNHIITRGDRIPLSQSFLLMLERQCKQLSVSPQQRFVSLRHFWNWNFWAVYDTLREDGRHVSMSAPMASPVLWRWDDGDVTQDVTCHTHDGSHSTLTLDTPKLLSCLREESHSGQQTAPPDHSTPADEKAQVTAGSLNCKSNPLFWRDQLQTQIWWQEQF